VTQPGRRFHLALREVHSALGAQFRDRAGWSVPEHYGDPLAEYRAIREGAALLDLSDRSRFIVSGTDALDVLRATFAGHLEDLEEGRAMRSAALDGTGNVRDLVLAARTGGIAYLVSGEPSQRDETASRLRDHVAPDYDVRIDDRTETTCVLALAGPAAESVAREHLNEGLPARLATLGCAAFEFHGFRTLVTRTSNLGEDGFELMVAPAVGQHLIEVLRGAGIRLAGRAAAEAARVESCIPAFVPDLETGLSPAEADLDVLLDIPGGRERVILSAVLVEGREVPAPGTPARLGGEVVGEVRSAVDGYGVASVVALAAITTRVALPGTALDLDGLRGTIVAKPFYRRRRQE
jgi:glycine cleavage system aminomethyltransferase T